MRFPSFVTLAERTRDVVLRFPWTMAAGVVTAAATIIATDSGNDHKWPRIAMVAALGLPLTVALTLLAEEKGWPAARKAALNAGGVALLVLFYLVWPGPERKFETIRYFQLNAGLHLLVAALPFLGVAESHAFWQYNRRLFLGFLRAALFSAVLYVGLAIALGALDKLFGVDIPSKIYGRLYIIIAFIVNTGIFLAAVPRDLRSLAGDTEYPRVLKVFAQYILTPLVFIYLIILIAYLVKIVAGGEWPSGWIGWLVTSVAIAGLLGFLLVHPRRDDAGEAWIRTYTRWLFIGLIPAAVMLLVAFWKRVLPYGWTELRLLGVLLGFWLLLISVSYTLRQESGIRRIPVTLALLLLITLYGPISVTSLSVASQERRLARITAQPQSQRDGREASAALRFLLEHGARRQIAAAIPGTLPAINWDSLPRYSPERDSTASKILAVAGMAYVPEYSYSRDRYVYFNAERQAATPIAGYEWMLNVSSGDGSPHMAGEDTVRVGFDLRSGVAQIRAGKDSLRFDIQRLAGMLAKDSTLLRNQVAPERLRLEAAAQRRKAALMLEYLNGTRSGDSLNVTGWSGRLFLGKPD